MDDREAEGLMPHGYAQGAILAAAHSASGYYAPQQQLDSRGQPIGGLPPGAQGQNNQRMLVQGGTGNTPSPSAIPPQEILPDRPIGYGAFGVVW